jgi:Tfp pilus assembly protein PilZ
MKRSLEALQSKRESRRSLKTEARFMVLSEAETITIDKNWTADYGVRLHDGIVLAMDDQGMFLTAGKKPVVNLKLGEKVSVLFNLVGVEEKIKTEGEVVWINKYSNLYPKGFAIKFTDVNVKMKDFREGIDRSWVPEKKTNGQLSVLNVPD